MERRLLQRYQYGSTITNTGALANFIGVPVNEIGRPIKLTTNR